MKTVSYVCFKNCGLSNANYITDFLIKIEYSHQWQFSHSTGYLVQGLNDLDSVPAA